ncbi:MAG TPA: ergothioneine biosynthesis protein EgtB [Thermoanaerobaculia bacterium]|nr:ergothioneine biosynthesis protein EgtB [Thermoanaerobaculia bacterium]
MTSILEATATNPTSADSTANDLAARYRAVRGTTDQLTAPLSPEDATVQAMPDASPAKWHLAHTSWFFETFVLAETVAGYRPFHPDFRVLFNSYYNTLGAQHPRAERGLVTRPGLAEVRAYREHVDRHLLAVLAGRIEPALASLIEIGLQHEQQHQELILTDLKYLLSRNPVGPVYREPPRRATAGAPPLAFRRFEEELLSIGHEGPGFAFDNEGPRHRVFLETYEIASRLVTNGEYLAFMADGGYDHPELWLSDGWREVQAQGWRSPQYWREREERDGVWQVFTLGGERALDLDEPVCHISFYEADAYARWAGARLPTEAEWEIAALESGASPRAGNFLEDGLLHPAPAPTIQAGEIAQLFGDVWEWTESPYTPYPGYHPPEGALGEYNGKFMCNQIVLRGGSCATPRSHIRATYRNFFPPSARWQFMGLRLARDAR